MSKVRAQRDFLKYLREKKKVEETDYKRIYKMVKGGFFRSVSHLKIFMKKRSE